MIISENWVIIFVYIIFLGYGGLSLCWSQLSMSDYLQEYMIYVKRGLQQIPRNGYFCHLCYHSYFFCFGNAWGIILELQHKYNVIFFRLFLFVIDKLRGLIIELHLTLNVMQYITVIFLSFWFEMKSYEYTLLTIVSSYLKY